jgi:NDMA-dependent alcohol dehydrogenase
VIESRAAVIRDTSQPMTVEMVRFEDPHDAEIVVAVHTAALCHSDVFTIRGSWTKVPMIPGHEASGTVESIGPGVDGVAVGDKVIFNFIPPCGECHFCLRGQPVDCVRGMGDGTMLDGTTRARTRDGLELRQATRLGVFSERVVVHRDSVLVVPPDTDLRTASLLSCGFTTGAGAAVNLAAVRPGESVLVVGVGGVGAAALQGAVSAGAAMLIAVDVSEEKLDLARTFGATHTIDAREGDFSKRVLELTGGFGADKAMLCVGSAHPEQVVSLIASIAPGATAVLVGYAGEMSDMPIPPSAIGMSHKTIRGCRFGSDNPKRDQLHFLDLHNSGRLKLEEMITRTYALDEINEAVDDLESGRNCRGVIEFGGVS